MHSDSAEVPGFADTEAIFCAGYDFTLRSYTLWPLEATVSPAKLATEYLVILVRTGEGNSENSWMGRGKMTEVAA